MRKDAKGLRKARDHLARVETMLETARRNSNGQLTVKLLDTAPFELEI